MLLRLTSAALTFALVSSAPASFVGFTASSYLVVEGPSSWAVIDMYACYGAADDVLLNIFDANIFNTNGAGFFNASDPGLIEASFKPQTFGAAVSGAWAADSFVTIGLDQTAPESGVLLDPGFDDPAALASGVIGPGAGWFNIPPTNGQGLAGDDLKVLVGRFSIVGVPTSPTWLSFEAKATIPGGIVAPPTQLFQYVPTPSALTALVLAGLARRGGRTRSRAEQSAQPFTARAGASVRATALRAIR